MHLLALLVEDPLKLTMLWNLLVQPRVREFHRELESLHLCAWKLSDDSSSIAGFSKEIAKIIAINLRSPQHVFSRKSGLDSSVGIMEGISLHSGPLFSR